MCYLILLPGLQHEAADYNIYNDKYIIYSKEVRKYIYSATYG